MHCSSSRMHWNCASPINTMISQSHKQQPQPSPGHVSYPTDDPNATRLRLWNSLPQLCPGWQDQNGADPPKSRGHCLQWKRPSQKSRTLSSMKTSEFGQNLYWILLYKVLLTISIGLDNGSVPFFGTKPYLKLLMIQQFAENNHASLLAVLVYIMRQKEANISTNEDPGHWLKCTFTCLS